MDLVEERGKLLRVSGFSDSLTPSSFRGLDHHRVTNTLCYLQRRGEDVEGGVKLKNEKEIRREREGERERCRG